MEVVSDFDGTIINIDAVEYLLAQFANGDWQRYDALYERGKIPLEECLRRQYRMIKEPRRKLLDAIDNVASFREGFDELLALCRERGIPFTIVSAGLDFVIRHLLESKNLQNQITFLAPKSKPTPRGIVLDFSELPHGGSLNFKGELVQSIKAKGERVAYIGDGFSDFDAVKEANSRFVIKGTKLEEECRKHAVACHEIVSLEEVTHYLVGPRTLS